MLILKKNSFIKKTWIIENPSSQYARNTGVFVGDGRFELAIVKGNGYKTIRSHKTAIINEGIYIGGQMNEPLDLEIFPESHLTFIKLEPWAVGLFSEYNFAKSLNETISFESINPAIHKKIKTLSLTKDVDAICEYIDQTLHALAENDSNWELIKYCCTVFDTEYMDFKSGKKIILENVSLSARTIEKKFAQKVGLSPQQYSTGIRFRRATEELKYGDNTISLTELAHKHGFYDQAHFTRLFKKYWGFTPKNFLRNKSFITNKKEPFRYYTI